MKDLEDVPKIEEHIIVNEDEYIVKSLTSTNYDNVREIYVNIESVKTGRNFIECSPESNKIWGIYDKRIHKTINV